MTQATGALSKLVMGFEPSFKTDATDGFIMPIVSSNVKSTRAKNASSVIRGNLNPPEPFDGNVAVSGTIVVPVDSSAMYQWLKAAFGDPTTAGTDPYTHAFKLGGSRYSIVIEHQFLNIDTPQYFKYNGCKVSSFGFGVGGDGELLANIGIVGARETIGTSSFDGSATVETLSKLQNFQAALTEGGSELANSTNFDFDVQFNVDSSVYVIGAGGELGGAADGVASIGGNMSTVFEDVALLTKAINATESAIVMTLTSSASSIMSVNLPEVQYARDSPAIEGPQGIQVKLPYQAYYNDATEATAIVTTLTNSDERA